MLIGLQPLDCTFTPTSDTPPQGYDGVINTLGPNIGIGTGSIF